MTTNRTITIARQHLNNGNRGAYERVMSGAVRGALTKSEKAAYIAALKEDGYQVA